MSDDDSRQIADDVPADVMDTLLTDEWLSEVLGAAVRVRAAKRIGDGLVGMNVRLALDSVGSGAGMDELPKSLIAKLPSPDPTSRMTGITLGNYEREVQFYASLAGTVDIRAARCYHHMWDAASGDFVLLLEDLAPGAQGNQITGCSVDQAQIAVLELAKLHGPRWGDASLEDVAWLQRRTPEDADRLGMLWAMFLPGFMATYGQYLSVEAADLIQRFGPRIPEWIEGRTMPLTVTHGDYRLDNLMFATPEGGYPVAAVDWQTPGQGPATADVSYFMGAGLQPDERRAVERALLADYGAALADYSVAVDSDALWHHYARDAYGGVVMAVIASQLVGGTERSEAMFAAMATRHAQHCLDLDAESLIAVGV
jgi:hypothetical protein